MKTLEVKAEDLALDIIDTLSYLEELESLPLYNQWRIPVADLVDATDYSDDWQDFVSDCLDSEAYWLVVSFNKEDLEPEAKPLNVQQVGFVA